MRWKGELERERHVYHVTFITSCFFFSLNRSLFSSLEVSCTDIKFHLGKGELLGRYRFKRGGKKGGGKREEKRKKEKIVR